MGRLSSSQARRFTVGGWVWQRLFSVSNQRRPPPSTAQDSRHLLSSIKSLIPPPDNHWDTLFILDRLVPCLSA